MTIDKWVVALLTVANLAGLITSAIRMDTARLKESSAEYELRASERARTEAILERQTRCKEWP